MLSQHRSTTLHLSEQSVQTVLEDLSSQLISYIAQTMDSDWRDERDIQHVLEYTAEASANYPKTCYSSQLYTHRSVDRHLGSDLRRYRYSDITLEKVLRYSFGVSDTDMDALKNRVKELAAHKTEDYKIFSSELINAAGSPEVKTYGVFADMGNMVLDAHQQQFGNRINFLYSICNGRDCLAIRKLLVTLVSQKDRDTEIGLRTLRWDHMLFYQIFVHCSPKKSLSIIETLVSLMWRTTSRTAG